MRNEHFRHKFENFKRAYQVFIRTLQNYYKDDDNEINQLALIQAYEIVFELSWKLLKDYLTSEGYQVNSPKQTLRQAFEANYITDGELWLEALENRNLTVHTYDEETIRLIIDFITNRFANALDELYNFFKTI